MRVFILEDDPYRIKVFTELLTRCEVTVSTSVPDAIAAFEPPYDILCLDHDLDGRVYVDSAEENTGAGFVRWLIQNEIGLNGNPILVHSYNPAGAARMVADLLDAGKTARWVPFGPTLFKILNELISCATSVQQSERQLS